MTTYEVRHTPEGADDYKLCDTYETYDEATAALLNIHLRYEMVPEGGTMSVSLGWIDGDLMVVVPGYGFYSIAESIPRKRFLRVVEGGFIHHYAVVDPSNKAVPITLHYSHKQAVLHHPDAADLTCEVVSMSEWLTIRREVNG